MDNFLKLVGLGFLLTVVGYMAAAAWDNWKLRERRRTRDSRFQEEPIYEWAARSSGDED